MKKIFLTIPWFSPAYKAGGPIQSVHNLVQALGNEYEFYIFTSASDLNGERLTGITKNKWVSFRPGVQVYYDARNRRSDRLVKECENIKPDLIYIVGLYSWHFSTVPLFFCKAPVKILSVRGMLHSAALRQKALKKNIFLSFLKFMGIGQHTVFHATDEQEEIYIKEVFGKNRKVLLASNLPGLLAPGARKEKRIDALRLISICLLSPMKNIHLVLRALQDCTATIIYDIYGVVKEEAYWQGCEEKIALLPPNIQVEFHGALPPAQVPEKLLQAHVYIQPSGSENYGHSLVQALSAGLPLITSTHTPWQHLQENEAGINVNTDPVDIATAINFFAAQPAEEFSLWQLGASTYIRSRVEEEKTINSYRKLFNTDARI